MKVYFNIIMILLSNIFRGCAYRIKFDRGIRDIHRASQMFSQSFEKPVRVRFAPSPTGSLHIGGARTALFNYLIAKKTGGKFILRIEDTDEARSTAVSEKSMIADLKWLKLDWDEGPFVGGPHGPYRQSERKHVYQKYSQKLIDSGHAYPCFCSEEDLTKKREKLESEGKNTHYDGTCRHLTKEEINSRVEKGENYAVRFRVPNDKVLYIDDVVRGRVTWDVSACLGDFIIMRSNGMPVYNFCVSVDDTDMEITHVIRAEEHLSNTLRQLLIFHALNKVPPIYAHCSLILGSDRSKLSKRHGATSLNQFKEQGYLPDGMINYLANLGWNDGTSKEIYSRPELVEVFSLDRIVKSAAVFDIDRLKWINSQHIRNMTSEQVTSLYVTHLQSLWHQQSVSTLNDNTKLSPEQQAFLCDAIKLTFPHVQVLGDVETSVSELLQYPFKQLVTVAVPLNDPVLSPENTFHTEQVSHAPPLADSYTSLNASSANASSDRHVAQEIIQGHDGGAGFAAICNALIRDFEAGSFPVPEALQHSQLNGDGDSIESLIHHVNESDKKFLSSWKGYMKRLEGEVGRKGKALWHPVRLAITGRVSGADVGEQILFLSKAERCGVYATSNTSMEFLKLEDRMKFLKDYLHTLSSTSFPLTK